MSIHYKTVLRESTQWKSGITRSEFKVRKVLKNYFFAIYESDRRDKLFKSNLL